MILASGVTEEDRRAMIRSLADISGDVFEAADFDKKIENADSIALSMFQYLETPDQVPRNLMTVANLMASVLIRSGIGDSQNDQMARLQKEMAEKIVKVYNSKAPEQNQQTITKTDGYYGGDHF